MANRLKSSNRKVKPDQLKQESEEKVTVQQLVKDERTHKIAGSACLMTAAFLFFSFTSYLFTWSEDQDKVLNQGATILLPSAHVKTDNLLGNIGAYISHQFFFNGFGLASYFLCTFFFVIGVNGFFTRKYFSIWRNLRYVMAGMIYFTVLLSFVSGLAFFSFGGT